LKNKSVLEIIAKYDLDVKKIRKVENSVNDVKLNKSIITTIDYRPFDFKHTIYTGVSNGLMGRPRDGIMKHMLKENIALLTCRQQTPCYFQYVSVSGNISDGSLVSLQTGEVKYMLPLYNYKQSHRQ